MWRFLLLVLVAWGASGCAVQSQPNVILIVIDTLRADRLGCYGNDRQLTPFIDSLAERGVVFHRAYALSSWTSPSVASLFTSRFPSQHGVVSLERQLADGELTLAEILQQQGYATGGFTANRLLRGTATLPDGRPGRGFGQGFDRYLVGTGKPFHRHRRLRLAERASEINDVGLDWLDRLPREGGAGIFLYLHYMEPHIPYNPPESALKQVIGERPLPDLERVTYFNYHGNRVAVSPAMLQLMKDVYDAEVISMDAQLRDLFASLEERGFLENTIVVITADHGEEFKDHGLIGHGKTLYEEMIRVPLIVVLPNQESPVDIEEPVSLLDVAPMLLELLGLPQPESFEGRSLATFFRPPSRWDLALRWLTGADHSTTEPVFSELIRKPNHKRLSPHERAVVSRQHKLITGVDGSSEFYDLAVDRFERNSTALTATQRTSLRDQLAALVSRGSQRVAPTKNVKLDAGTQEHLRRLGYVD